MRKRGLCCRPVSVCPSVSLSVTLVDCIHTAEDIAKLSPIILLFDPRRRYRIPRETPQRWQKIHGGWKKIAIFDRNRRLSRKGTR